MVYRWMALTATAAVLTLVGVPVSAVAQVMRVPKHYVALGDSYATGPGIPNPRIDSPGCFRSTNNYPARLAAG